MNMSKLFILLSLVCVFSLSSFAQSDIRKVDFKNFTYDVQIFEVKEKLTLKNGEFDRNTEDDKLFFTASVDSYGDIDGDGNEEAVVLTIMNTGGTGNFSSGIIFTMKGGKPVVLTEFAGGDRAYGGLVGARILDKKLIVEQYDVGEAGGACCPEFIVTTTLSWNGKELVAVGKQERREMYPLNRIQFEKGKSLSTLPIKIEKYDRKRFVVGAKKGQTLLVSSAAKGISYSLFKGEGEVENTDNGMIVKLNENGDFVFEVANDNDKDMEFSITVEIN
jgi:hypothetical protein